MMERGWHWWRSSSYDDPIPRFVSYDGLARMSWITSEIGTGKLVSVDYEGGYWGPRIEWPSDDEFGQRKVK